MRLATLFIAAAVAALCANQAAGGFIPGNPATGTLKFFDGDQLEAVFEITAVEPGSSANGYRITIFETSVEVAPVTPSFSNVSSSVAISASAISVTYQEILAALDFPPAVSATLTRVAGDALYNPPFQTPPPIVFLDGGIDPVIPEPTAAVLVTVLGSSIGFCGRRRQSARRRFGSSARQPEEEHGVSAGSHQASIDHYRHLAGSCATIAWFRRAATVALLLSLAFNARADTFGSGENAFSIEFVAIGDPGNPADTTGDPNPAGRVDYLYWIGKYEISEDAIRKANAQSALDGDPLDITIDERGPRMPATRVSWFEAARFVNWLNEDKGATPAYKFDASGEFRLWAPGDLGYDPANPFRNTQARYFLPSVDEWYKAAYYDPVTKSYFDFPTGSDDPPIPVASGTDPGTAVWNQLDGPADAHLAGGESPFGTVGQGGNVLEWEETARDLENTNVAEVRGVRGGDYVPSITSLDLSSSFRNASLPNFEPTNVGFRVASIPEASTCMLAFFVIATRHCVSRRSRDNRIDTAQLSRGSDAQ